VSNLDDLVTVIRLACMTEDRSDTEQKALLRLARKADKEWNAMTVTNRKTWEHRPVNGEPAWVLLRDLLYLEDEVQRSRELVDNQKRVTLPEKGRWKLDETIRAFDGRAHLEEKHGKGEN